MKCRVGIVPKPKLEPEAGTDTDRQHFLRRRAQILARRGPDREREAEPETPAYLQAPSGAAERAGEEAEAELEVDVVPRPGLERRGQLPEAAAEVGVLEELPEPEEAWEPIDGMPTVEPEAGEATPEEVAAEDEAEEEAAEGEEAVTGEEEEAPTEEALAGEADGQEVLAPEEEEQPRPTAPSMPAPPAGMRAIRQQVSQRAQAMPTPRITAGTAAVREAEFVRERAETEQGQRREGLDDSAAEAMPEMPDELPESLSSPDNPVPDIQEPLRDATNRTLPDQTPPRLIRTPQGNMPELGRRPLPPDRIRELSRFMDEGPQMSDPNDLARTRLQMQWEALMSKPEVQEGEGEQQPLVDIPPPTQAQVPQRNKAKLSQALARLLQDPNGEAQRMMDRARGEAFVGSILNRVEATQSVGDDQVGEFGQVFGTQLDSIREEAGIAAEELDQAVQDRRDELEEERRAEEEELQMCIADEGAAITAENQAVADAIDGARRGMDAQTEEVQASMGGADRVRAIEGRRDRLLDEVTSLVAREDADYRRAGETRASELDSLQRAQEGAYRYAVQQDEFQLNQEPGERTQVRIQELVAESREWLTETLREVRSSFSTMKTTASTTTTTNREDITSAGNDAKTRIREWANTELGEETSFWDRLLAMIDDWLSQAEANADAWETVQNTEHAEAASGYIDMLGQVERAADAGITEEEILQSNNLTAEERAVVQAYFEPPQDPIYAVAVGIRERIYSQRREELVGRLESQVLDGDYDWTVLEEIGRAYNPDFDAGRRANELAAGFYPGLTGLGTEEDQVFAALAGLNPVQAKAVRKAYRALHGESLEDALASEMDTDGERNRARSLLSGDQATADAAALHMAMDETWLGTGFGTESDVIFTTLRNKSPEEIEAIITAYERDYPGTGLRERLREELNDWATLSSHDEDRAMALMASDTELADVIAVDQSLHGFSWGYAFNLAYGTSFEAGSRDEFTAVYDTIRQEVAAQATREQWTDAQFQAELQRRVQRVETRYSEQYPWRDLEGAVEERFEDGPNRDLVMATLNNDELRAEAARVAIENDHWLYASDDVIIDVVERRYDRALEGVRRDMGPELQREMEAEIRARDQAHFEETGERLTGEEIFALRAELEVANEQTMEEEARRRAEADTARMDEVYQEEYHESLESAVQRGTSGVTGEHAEKALEQGGYLTRYQRLDFATRIVGTDEAAADRAFEGATPDEIAEMDDLWRANHGGQSMRDGLLGGWSNLGFGELSGDDALDMQVSLEGRAMTVDDAVRIARLREQLAEPSSFMGIEVAGAEYGLIEQRRRQLEENAERLRQPVITEEDRRQRDHILDEFAFNQQAVQTAVEQHRARVSAITDAIANTASMIVAVAVGAAIAFFSGGTATPLAIALIASVAGTMTSMGVRMAMLGNRYGHEEFMTDAVIGVVDAIAAAATAGIGNRLLGISQIARSAGGSGMRGVMGAIQRRLSALLSKLPDIGPLARNMRTSQWLSQMSKGRWYQQALAHGIAESVENAAGAFPTAVVTNLIDDRNWEGGLQVGNVLTGIGTQVGMGVGMGLGMSVGMKGLGRFYSGITGLARGPRLGAEPRLTTPDQLPLNDAQYQAGLREFQNANPGRSAADFDAIIQSERQGHLQDYLARNPGKTEADFDAYLRQESARSEAEFGEMHRGRRMDFDVERGREAAEVLGRAHEEAQARQAIRDELSDALPESRRGDLADVPVSRLSDAEFTRATGQLTGDAAVVVRDGQAHLVVREGADPGSVRSQASQLADMTAPGTAGRVADPAGALPRDLRGRVHIETNPDLPPRSVQVHYETHNGLITAVWVEAGPGARAIDIQMHAPTVRAMRRLQGISGQIRQALDRMAAWLGRNPRPAPGTRAFEARLEMEKLPGIIQERAQALSRATTLEEQLRIAAEIEHLQAQATMHAEFVNAIDAEPGRGYVAAEGLTQAEVQARIAQFETPEVRQALRDLDPAEQAQVLQHMGSLRGVLDSVGRQGGDPVQAVGQFVDAWRRMNALPDADPQVTGKLLQRAGEAEDVGTYLGQLRSLIDRVESLPQRPDGMTQRWLGHIAEAPSPARLLDRISQVSDSIARLPDSSAANGARLLDTIARGDHPDAGLVHLATVVSRLADMPDASQARIAAWIDKTAASASPERFIADLARTITEVDDALGGASRHTAGLLDHIQGVPDPTRHLAGLRGLVEGLDAPNAKALLERMAQWRDPIAGGGSVAEFIGDIGRLMDHPTARGANRGDYVTAIAQLMEQAADAGQRRDFAAQVGRLLDNGRITAETLGTIAERLRGETPPSQRPVSGPLMAEYVQRIADFVDQAGPLIQRLQATMPMAVNAHALLNDLAQSAAFFRSAKNYLGENLPALLRALDANLHGPNPNHAAARDILDYLARLSHDPEGISADLMASGRRIINRHGEAGTRNPGALHGTLKEFAENLAGDTGRMAGTETWEGRLMASQGEFRDAHAGRGTAAEQQAAAIIQNETNHPGWTDGHRGMLMRQLPWMQQLADATGLPLDQIVRHMIDPQKPFTREGRYETARRNLRDRLLDHVFRDGVNRPDMEMLAGLLARAPDPGAKGILFEQFMRRRFGRLTPEQAQAARKALMADIDRLQNPRIREWLRHANEKLLEWQGNFGESHINGMRAAREGTRQLPGGRSADDAAVVDIPRIHMGGPGRGPVLIDYKAGRGAFQEDQARRYIKMLIENGGRMVDANGNMHNGLIYIADSPEHAAHAMQQVEAIIADMMAKGEIPPGSRQLINLYFASSEVDAGGGVRLRFLWRPWHSWVPSE